jgi:hypothetical protein
MWVKIAQVLNSCKTLQQLKIAEKWCIKYLRYVHRKKKLDLFDIFDFARFDNEKSLRDFVTKQRLIIKRRIYD